MSKTNTSISKYLKYYDESFKRLMQREDLKEYEGRSVYTTWNLSFDYIRRNDADGAAAKMLQLWSLLDNKDLWYELLSGGFQRSNEVLQLWQSDIPDWFRRINTDPLTFNDVVETLLAYSMIEAKQGSDAFSIHSVVHEWCGRSIDPESRMDYIFLGITSIAFSLPKTQGGAFYKVGRRMLPHVERFTQDLVEALCLRTTGSELAFALHFALLDIGHFYNFQFEQKKAHPFHQKDWDLCKKAFDPSDEKTLAAQGALGNSFRILGLQKKDMTMLKYAENISRGTFAREESRFGPDHPDTLASKGNLAEILMELGNLNEAEVLYTQMMSRYRYILSSGEYFDPQVYQNTADGLRKVYDAQGKSDQADTAAAQVVEIAERFLGPNDRATFDAYLRKAKSAATEAEALECLSRAWHGFQAIYGPTHLKSLDAEIQLGMALAAQHKLCEAEPLLRHVLEGLWVADKAAYGRARNALLQAGQSEILRRIDNATQFRKK